MLEENKVLRGKTRLTIVAKGENILKTKLQLAHIFTPSHSILRRYKIPDGGQSSVSPLTMWYLLSLVH